MSDAHRNIPPQSDNGGDRLDDYIVGNAGDSDDAGTGVIDNGSFEDPQPIPDSPSHLTPGSYVLDGFTDADNPRFRSPQAVIQPSADGIDPAGIVLDGEFIPYRGRRNTDGSIQNETRFGGGAIQPGPRDISPRLTRDRLSGIQPINSHQAAIQPNEFDLGGYVAGDPRPLTRPKYDDNPDRPGNTEPDTNEPGPANNS